MWFCTKNKFLESMWEHSSYLKIALVLYNKQKKQQQQFGMYKNK